MGSHYWKTYFIHLLKEWLSILVEFERVSDIEVACTQNIILPDFLLHLEFASIKVTINCKKILKVYSIFLAIW